ncbi:MAG: protein translocase subunit SecD [Planctomycetota bacterium]|nr:protein translocase subunit SecD [Planctomycetota bacterium]
MVRNLGWRLIWIAILIGLLGWQAFKGVVQKELELGIDLKGGSELIFKFEFQDLQDSQKPEVLKEAIGVIQERIDGFGLKDIAIQPIGSDRFAVQVSAKDKQNVDSIKDLITDLGDLEFRITVEPGGQSNYDTYWRKYQDRKKKDIPETVASKLEVEDLEAADRDRYPFGLRWYPLGDRARSRNWSGRVPSDENGNPQPYLLCKLDQYGVSGGALFNVMHSPDQRGIGGGWAVYFRVKKLFQGNMDGLTQKKGDFMAIVLNGQVDSAPELQSTLSDSGQITGGFTEKEARSLAAILQAGSLRERPELISERTIAPELAGDARSRGILSVLFGFVLVLGIMFWLYMGPGLLANIALLLNLVLLIGVLTWFGAVLTLPGIAGVVLTVGMAVDANILVFERIKEEKGKGRTEHHSVGIGYDRALVTIVDANLTTLITAYFLFQIGSGPVRGFGITLAIGIIASMFTALYVTRTFFAWFLKKDVTAITRMRGDFKPPGFRWTNHMRTAITISSIAMVTGAVLWDLVPEKVKYDLDFTKGSKLIVRFHEARSSDGVSETIDGMGKSNALYDGVAVRASAEGIGAEVVGDSSREFELRSQDIANAAEIDAFKGALSETFKGQLLPGPFRATITAAQGGGSEGTLYLVSKAPTEEVVRAALTQYVARTRRLEGAVVTAGKKLPGAGAAFVLRFPNESPDTAGQIALNVKRALSEFSVKAAREKLQQDAEDDDKTGSEQERAKAALEKLKDVDGAMLPTYFAECDPFPLADRIDPSTAQEHRDAAVRAIGLSILGIILYVAFRFRSWSFGFAAVIALIHDVLVVLGLVALANWLGIVDARLNLVTVAAFLTLIGYSINDSIVVFDRIRENHGNRRSGLRDIIDRSINQTLSRTLRTTTTTWIVVLTLLVMNFGKNSALEGFAFVLALGVLVGTYSSIFIASPTLLFVPWLWEQTGGSIKSFFKKCAPFMIGAAVLLVGFDTLTGRMDFSTDFSLPLFNNLALAIPIGILALFLMYMLRFVRLDENGPVPALTS